MRHQVVLVALLASRAFGQPASGAQGESLYREGRRLLDAGQLAEACAAFDESGRVDPQSVTLFAAAACREQNHQLASAWGGFLEVERMTRSSSDETAQQLHELAGKRAAALEPRISKLTIIVGRPVPGLEIVRDKDRIEKAQWNRALPVDGGTYKITGQASDHQPWTHEITVKPEGDVQTIEVPDLVVVARPLPVVSKQPASVVLPISFGGGALVLGGAALGAELWARSTFDAAKDEMTNQTHRDKLASGANHERYLAEGLAVAGIASAGVAVWLYLRGRSDERPDAIATHVSVSPMGLAFAGAF